MNPLVPNPRNPLSLRAILLGLVGVVIICGITPYNDYALRNTFFVGNNLPLGLILLLFLFVLLVNGPLWRFAPRHAFSAGELTVSFSMALVSCALPSSGLMRYFPASLVIPFFHARSNAEFRELFDTFGLPSWLFPSMEGDSIREWMNSPLVEGYYRRWTGEGPVPYAAWIQPAVTWGIFLFALYGALLCMVTIVRRQWHENERLPFPLAQIHLALIETPRPGRLLNDVLSRRSFWIAFVSIFFLHIWNGLELYHPKYFPRIPVYYNLWSLMGDPPWSYADYKIKDAAIFFTVVGVTYFLNSSVAFSLWAFYILHNLHRMALGTLTGDPTIHGRGDQHFGGIVAFFLTILWVGRGHWKLVILQAFRGHRDGEPRGRYLSYPVAFWGLIGCFAVMVLWLILAGSTLFGAVVMVGLLLLLFFIITRIVAEVGLVHGQLQVSICKPWQLLGMADVQAVPPRTFYLSALLQSVHYDYREVVPVYASHGLKVADKTVFGDVPMGQDSNLDRKFGRHLIGALLLALLVGYVMSFASTLWTEYTYGVTQDVTQEAPINLWGADQNPNGQVVNATVAYNRLNYPHQHNPAVHFTFGFLFTAFLGAMRLLFSWWPLHPIGYLMIGTFPGAHLWLSFFVGWLVKSLILRFGGADFYTRSKPFFLGLIVGESIAAAFWLLVAIVLNSQGIPYRAVNIMPG